jgi:hypothetical protein
MTISNHLKRRIRILLALLIATWLAIPLSDFLFRTRAPQIAGISWPILASFAVFAGVMYLLVQVRCPNCKDSLFGIVGDIAFDSVGEDRVRWCPHCRADFDAPLEDG